MAVLPGAPSIGKRLFVAMLRLVVAASVLPILYNGFGLLAYHRVPTFLSPTTSPEGPRRREQAQVTREELQVSGASRLSPCVPHTREVCPTCLRPSVQQFANRLEEVKEGQYLSASESVDNLEVDPAVTDPAVTDPAVTDPAVTDPAVTHLAVTDPAVTNPAVTDPAVADPAVTDRAVADLAVTELKTDSIVTELITNVVLVPDFICSDVYLLAVQPSILDRRQERDTVRATWGSVAREQKWPGRKINAKVKVMFVVADQLSATGEKDNSGEPFQLPEHIIAEARENNDILYVRMNDSYTNLTLKLLSAFKWVKDNCPCVKFVLKVDYDTFVNVPLLVDTLLYFENRFNLAILGKVYLKQRNVQRHGRWAVSRQLYPMSSYPPYVSGCGYVLSYSALTQIVYAAPHFRFLPIEDAFITGILRRVVGCRLFYLPGLFTHFKDTDRNPCRMVMDMKILGMTALGQKHQFVWKSFLAGSC